MVNAVHQIVAAANNALQENDDCEEVVSQTQQSFHRRRRPLQRPRRGRRSYSFFKRKVLLLRLAYADCCPIKEECEMLTSWGLGYSVVEPKFLLDWNTEEMEDYICSLYPKVPLKLVGFKLAKMDRQKKLLYINVDNVKNLREAIGQSQIVIIPNRDLSVPVDTNRVDMQTADASVTIGTSVTTTGVIT
ncbi:hypothetical protein FQA39_LY16086 [Lamprigera yunnana]|nr:hypothetical protein FQA39_LY16086 [Lamprigera yunnana]